MLTGQQSNVRRVESQRPRLAGQCICGQYVSVACGPVVADTVPQVCCRLNYCFCLTANAHIERRDRMRSTSHLEETMGLSFAIYSSHCTIGPTEVYSETVICAACKWTNLGRAGCNSSKSTRLTSCHSRRRVIAAFFPRGPPPRQ